MKTLFIRLIKSLVILLVLIQLWILVSLVWWKSQPVKETMFMRIQTWDSEEPIQHKWQGYDNISANFKRAVLVGEDAKFVHHNGFDWDGVQTAIERNEESGEVVAGGSTVSQQLAKNLFLYNQRSFVRKAQEAVATVMMETLWSKQRILEVYMNSVELGENIYGVEAASRHYFHKSSRNLSQQQAIFLASLLPNPKYYQAHSKDSHFKFKQRFIAKYFYSVEIPK